MGAARGRRHPMALLLLLVSVLAVVSGQGQDLFNLWAAAPVELVEPPPAAFSLFEFVEEAFVLFGGIAQIPLQNGSSFETARLFSQRDSYLNDTWVYSFFTLQWYKVPVVSGVSPRAAMASGVLDYPDQARVLMFGGMSSQGVLDDLWKFDFYTDQWLLVTPTNTGPQGRWGAASIGRNQTMYILGGAHDLPAADLADMSELWTFTLTNGNATTGSWTKITMAGPTPRITMFPIFTYFNGIFILAGGWDATSPSDPPNNGTFVFADPSFTYKSYPNHTVPLGGARAVLVAQDGVEAVVMAMFGNKFSWELAMNPQVFTVSSWDVFVMHDVESDWVLFEQGDTTALASTMPPGTIGGGLASSGNVVMKFGGFDTYLGAPVGTLHLGTPQINSMFGINMLWVVGQVNSKPESTLLACSASINQWVFVVGGWSSTFSDTANIWGYNTINLSWIVLDTGMPARAGARAVTVDTLVFVTFGGYQKLDGTPTFFNDIWIIDSLLLQTYGVTVKSSVQPPGRQGHSAVLYNGDQIVIYGGFSCTHKNCLGFYSSSNVHNFDDLWSFNIVTQEWTELLQSGTAPTPRAFHFAAVLLTNTQPKMYLYGGMQSSQHPVEGFYTYDFTTSTWASLDVLDNEPRSRTFACGAALAPANQAATKFLYTSVSVLPDGTAAQRLWIFDANYMAFQELDMNSQVPLSSVVGQTCVVNGNGLVFYLFGGQDLSSSAYSDQFLVASPTCNLGQTGPFPLYKEGKCTACPVGTFAESHALSECTQCPGDTFTGQDESVSRNNCTECSGSESCGGHGSCSVLQGFSVICDCDFGHTGRNCEVPTFELAFSITMGVVVLSVLVGCGLKHFRGKLYQIRVETEEQAKLLHATKFELQEMESVWHIHDSDIKIKHSVGIGANGQVFLARYFDKEVAVKVLHEQLAELSEEFLLEFEREAKFLRTLRHRNLVFFYGAGTLQGAPFIVTEFCARGALRHVLDDIDQPLVWAQQLEFAINAAEGMRFLHSRNRVHRDLKCANLLITRDWICKVGDFGTSRTVVEQSQPWPRAASMSARHRLGSFATCNRTMTTGIGTLLWIAPEMLAQMPKQCAMKADVYSFGICMFEIATRKYPFQEREHIHVDSLAELVIEGARPELSQVPAHVPQFFLDAMQACWAPNPDDRPTFEQVAEMLLRGPKEVTRTTNYGTGSSDEPWVVFGE